MPLWALMIGWFLSAASASCMADAPAFESFRQLLARNPATGKPVQNLDELLPLLSPELRSNFTFVYNSRSPHGGQGVAAEKSVDPLFPRTVLFTKDGKLTLAFTGNPEKPGYGTIEAIHFDDRSASFALSQFVLPQAGGSADNGVLNPPQCLRCHGSDPRPITDSYPLWPGFYGSVRDTFPKGSPELPLYRRFLAEQSKKGVYRHLQFPEGSSVSPYLDPAHYNPNKMEGATDELKFLPNTRLGMAWTELNRRRLGRKLRASPQYLRYRVALLSGLLGCETLPIPRQTDEAVYSDIYYENEDRLQRLGYRPEGPEKSELDMMELSMYENISQIQYLGKALEIDSGDWSLAFESRSLSFFDGILSGMLGEKNFYLKEDFIFEILSDLAKDEPRLRRYFQAYGSYEAAGYPFGVRIDLSKAVGACSILKKKPKVRLPRFAVAKVQTRNLESAQSYLQRKGLAQAPFTRCTSCHEGAGGLSSGRKIPFSEPSALWLSLKGKAESGKALAQEIVERIELHGDGQMPPKGERLAAEEKTQLLQYIEWVQKS